MTLPCKNQPLCISDYLTYLRLSQAVSAKINIMFFLRHPGRIPITYRTAITMVGPVPPEVISGRLRKVAEGYRRPRKLKASCDNPKMSHATSISSPASDFPFADQKSKV